jgi:uncharacterized membrane protein
MNALIIIAIIFGSIITLAGILCGTVLLVIKMRNSGLSSTDRKTMNEEAMTIQEIYRGLERMEERVESLETILMDRQKDSGENK